eukprot:53561-Eustigmatos_ZCMA.PRE.1
MTPVGPTGERRKSDGHACCAGAGRACPTLRLGQGRPDDEGLSDRKRPRDAECLELHDACLH